MEKQKKKRIALGAFFGLFSAAVVAAMVAIPLTFALVIKGIGGDEPISEHGFGVKRGVVSADVPMLDIYCIAHDAHTLHDFVLKKDNTILTYYEDDVDLAAGLDEVAHVDFEEPIETDVPIEGATLSFLVDDNEKPEIIEGIIVQVRRRPGWDSFTFYDTYPIRMQSNEPTDVGTIYSYKAQNLFSLYNPQESATVRISFLIGNENGILTYNDYELFSCKILDDEFEKGNGIISSTIGIPQIDMNFDSSTIYNQEVEVEIKSNKEIQNAIFIMQYDIMV